VNQKKNNHKLWKTYDAYIKRNSTSSPKLTIYETNLLIADSINSLLIEKEEGIRWPLQKLSQNRLKSVRRRKLSIVILTQIKEKH